MNPIGLTVLTFVEKKTDRPERFIFLYNKALRYIYIFICIKLGGKTLEKIG